MLGALFGFFVYATYDLTNLAILKHWDWTAAVADIAWGSLVTAIAAGASVALARAITGEA